MIQNANETSDSQAFDASHCSAILPPVLDACCGSRMFWFDKSDDRAVFIDKRAETIEANDVSSKGGKRTIHVSPDQVADFTDLPFDDESFHLVVFDPPHLTSAGETSWLAKKYGRLFGDWECEIAEGFSECFRVLKPNGTLVFKWNETDVPLEKVLSLTSVKPLFGHKTGRQSKTFWVCFIKDSDS